MTVMIDNPVIMTVQVDINPYKSDN
jgi:hypothetical protein